MQTTRMADMIHLYATSGARYQKLSALPFLSRSRTLFLIATLLLFLLVT